MFLRSKNVSLVKLSFQKKGCWSSFSFEEKVCDSAEKRAENYI
jgi:hypothetical protein